MTIFWTRVGPKVKKSVNVSIEVNAMQGCRVLTNTTALDVASLATVFIFVVIKEKLVNRIIPPPKVRQQMT